VLKLLGIVLLVVLILVGALMPLKYTARPKLPGTARPGESTAPDRSKEAAGD
jgi:hypothetical protein